MTRLTRKIFFLLWLRFNRFNQSALDALRDQYLARLPQTAPDRHPYCIGLIGSVAVGKTTVAEKIAARLPAVVLNGDDGRRLLHGEGYAERIVHSDKFIYFLGQQVLRQLVEQRRHIIIDGDLRRPQLTGPLFSLLRANGYRLYLCSVTAADATAQQRLRNRLACEPSGYLRKHAWRLFRRQKSIREKYPLPAEIFFHIQNDGTIAALDGQVGELVEKIKKQSLA